MHCAAESITILAVMSFIDIFICFIVILYLHHHHLHCGSTVIMINIHTRLATANRSRVSIRGRPCKKLPTSTLTWSSGPNSNDDYLGHFKKNYDYLLTYLLWSRCKIRDRTWPRRNTLLPAANAILAKHFWGHDPWRGVVYSTVISVQGHLCLPEHTYIYT